VLPSPEGVKQSWMLAPPQNHQATHLSEGFWLGKELDEVAIQITNQVRQSKISSLKLVKMVDSYLEMTCCFSQLLKTRSTLY